MNDRDCLFADIENNTLFTYKVKFDGGSAPNPFHGVCSLAICKPAIRAAAKIGDVIVGLGCKSNHDDERRIVYCMVVDEVLTWEDYNIRCLTGKLNRIPRDDSDPGDCIWPHPNDPHAVRPSSSGHDSRNYRQDVEHGKHVLLSSRFWYFGAATIGDGNVCVPERLNIVPYGQGHRSTSNDYCKQEFQDFFCRAVAKMPTRGRIGMPAIQPWLSARAQVPETNSALIAAQAHADSFGEEICNDQHVRESVFPEEATSTPSKDLAKAIRNRCGS